MITDTQRLDFHIERRVTWYPGYYDGQWQSDLKRGTMVYNLNGQRADIEGVDLRDATDNAIKKETSC